MEQKTQSIRAILLVIGVILALLIFTVSSARAQTQNQALKEYKCTPCGCSEDNVIVHEPGNCKKCGMALFNIHDPNEGLNYVNLAESQVCELISAKPQTLLLDVRSKGEFEQKTSQIGRLKSSINIPITEINDRLKELEAYKDKEILVHCSIGARSPRVSKILADNGFMKVKNLMGGLRAWNLTNPDEVPCKNDITLKK